jgi:SAM-dependent methyltransferase
MSATERKTCRACDGTDLASVLDLGNQPLANRLLTEEQLEWQEPDFPLHMVRCTQCGLCQLTHVVDPEVLYRNYAYESGHSPGWHAHCEALAEEITQRDAGGAVLDIAANDGTLLRHCFGRGHPVVGVEPARNLATGELPIYQEFWSPELADKIVGIHGRFEFIVAQNVFGHVDDARGFLQGIARALAPDGVAIIECPWVVDLIKHRRWDTIYHEHLSYWGLAPLTRLAKEVGLPVNDIRLFPGLHGGTMRYYLNHRAWDWAPSTYSTYRLESEFPGDDFDRFTASVKDEIRYWNEYLQNPLGRGLAGYGASAKASTFLNALPDRPKLVGIFDDNPRKHRLYTPGWHFPILKPTPTVMMACDEIINLAPNWPLEERAKSLGFTGEVKQLWTK